MSTGALYVRLGVAGRPTRTGDFAVVIHPDGTATLEARTATAGELRADVPIPGPVAAHRVTVTAPGRLAGSGPAHVARPSAPARIVR